MATRRNPSAVHPKAQSLVALFYRERARFARRYPKAARCELAIERGACISPDHCELRALAYALPDRRPPRIVLHFRLMFMPRANQLGVIRHEFGHVVDPTPEKRNAEQRADDLAEAVTGAKIRYDDRDIQTVGPGRYPRPKHLHR